MDATEFRLRRKETGLTLADAAKALGRARSNIQRYEQGASIPSDVADRLRQLHREHVERRQREWLIEQVANSIFSRVQVGLTLDEAIADAREVNGDADWTFDGPLTFTSDRLAPHERDSWCRYSHMALDAQDLERAVTMARQLVDEWIEA